MNELIASFKNGNFNSTEDFPSRMHTSVLPLILVKGDEFKLIGTAYIINKYFGLAVTAAHCISEVYGDYKNWPTNERNVDEDEGILHLGYFGKNKNSFFGGFTQITQIYMEKIFDVAVLRLKIPVPKFSKKPEESLLNLLSLDFSIPQVGEKCLVLGYNKESSWKKISDDYMEAVMDLKVSQGIIEEVIFEAGHPKAPSFRLNARVDLGMSGGPVISEKTGMVIGTVSSGFDFGGDTQDYVEYISHNSTLFPITVNCAPLDKRKKPTPFFVMAKRNYFSCINIKNINFFNPPNTTDIIAIYPNGQGIRFLGYLARFK